MCKSSEFHTNHKLQVTKHLRNAVIVTFYAFSEQNVLYTWKMLRLFRAKCAKTTERALFWPKPTFMNICKETLFYNLIFMVDYSISSTARHNPGGFSAHTTFSKIFYGRLFWKHLKKIVFYTEMLIFQVLRLFGTNFAKTLEKWVILTKSNFQEINSRLQLYVQKQWMSYKPQVTSYKTFKKCRYCDVLRFFRTKHARH